MHPITATDALQVGDVLHHPAFGFAVVDQADPEGASLRWERANGGQPPRVSRKGLVDAWRTCAPGGLFARSVTDPDSARSWLSGDPASAVGSMVAELGGAVSLAELREWLAERGLVTGRRFDGWWSAALPLVESDPRLEWRSGELRAREGVEGAAFAPDRVVPLPAAGTLGAGAAMDFAVRLARALADAHARGEVAVQARERVGFAGGEVRVPTLGSRSRHARRDDGRWAMRLVLEQVLGPLPSAEDLADADLVAVAAELAPALPPELLGVAQRALALDPDLRFSDGIALHHALRLGEATATTRALTPFDAEASWTAGFQTHIGALKSLQGQTNQDSFVLLGEPRLALAAVADGISIASAGTGDQASALFSRTLRNYWLEQSGGLRDAGPGRLHAFLQEALRRANRAICEAAQRAADGDFSRAIPMGTTALAAIVRGSRVHLAALGDSRAYIVTPGGAWPLTSDQNAQALRLREHLAGQPAAWDEHRFSLTGYLGYFGLDGRPELPPAFTRTFTLLPGEWLVLCTDGFTDFAASEDAAVPGVLTACLAEARGTAPGALAMDYARRLVDAANRGGGGDNVTVLVLTLSPDVGAPDEPGPVSSPP